MIDEMDILKKVAKLNRDNGYRFTVTDRANAIDECLAQTRYRLLNQDGLFHLYGTCPLHELNSSVFVIFSHIDCVSDITECFVEELPNGLMRGTFDNMLTNAAILTLMLRGELPKNVLVAFTGDEEENGVGVIQTARFLINNDISFQAIVLDVTDMAYDTSDFTIENDFLSRNKCLKIVESAKSFGKRWRFVPEDPHKLHDYVPKEQLINQEAAEDESWELDELNISCFSFCIPIYGDMHSADGCIARQESYRVYINALAQMIKAYQCYPIKNLK